MEFNCEGQNRENNGGIMMYNYGLDHRNICGHFLVLTDSPLMCEGRSSSYGRQTTYDQGRNGDNDGETRENHRELESPHSNYSGFWFVLLLKMDEVHIISNIYMDEVGIPMLISMYQYTNEDQGSK